MAIKTILLSRLEMDLKKTLNECAESGETVVVEMPDQRLLSIQPLDPQEDDNLIDELIGSNPRFQALVAKSKAGSRKPFVVGGPGLPNGGSFYEADSVKPPLKVLLKKVSRL